VLRAGNSWANWLLVGACVAALVCMMFFKEHYHRLSVDVGHDV
jgi:hypothetical protein